MNKFLLRIILCIFIGSIAGNSFADTKTLFKDNSDGTRILLGHMPQEVATSILLRHADANQFLDLRIVMPLSNQSGLNSLLQSLYDPTSPAYHKFLTPAQFNQQFRPSDIDTNNVKNYLSAQGFSILGQSPNGTVLHVTGPVSSVENTFKLHINNYVKSDGTQFFAPDSNPTIDVQIVGKISAVAGLDNSVKIQSFVRPIQSQNTNSQTTNSLISSTLYSKTVTPNVTGTGPNGWLAPNDIKTAYNLKAIPSVNGSLQNVALFEMDGYTPSDISAYEAYYNIPATSVAIQNVYIDGFNGVPSTSGGSAEVTIDIEELIGMGSNSINNIYVYEGSDSTQPWMDVWTKIANDDLAQVVSCSWGYPEIIAPYITFDSIIFAQMAAQGQEVFAASGDSGAFELPPYAIVTPQDPSTQPFVTGVGISVLSNNSNGAYVSESASLDSGGGISAYSLIPSYQQAMASLAPASSMVSTTYRNAPDVSLTADPSTSYAFYITSLPASLGVPSGWWSWWGSSIAAPIWASFLAQVNQGRVNVGQSTLGFINPALYTLANSSKYATDFHEITTGNNGFYPAEPGLNDATGLGSFNGLNLYNDLLAIPPAPVTPPSTPTGLNISVGAASVTLSWSQSLGATTYNVQRSTVSGGPYTTIATISPSPSPTYTDTSVTYGTVYYYVVSAVNKGGQSANSAQVTANTLVSQLLTPTPGSLIMATPVSFSWSQVAGATEYSLQLGSSLNANNYYNGTATTALSANVTFPINGQPVFVTLGTQIGGVWYYNEYAYNTVLLSRLLTPTAGSTITSSTVNFTWSTPIGQDAGSINLIIGSTPGSGNYFNGVGGINGSVNITIPLNASTVYVSLGTDVNGIEYYNNYSFNSIAISQLSAPLANSTITSNSTPFSWSAVTGATAYMLYVGTTPGTNNCNTGGGASTTATSATVTIPANCLNGPPIYATLFTEIGGVWYNNSYTFNTIVISQLQTPTPGSIIAPTTSNATNLVPVNFAWSQVNGATAYSLNVSGKGMYSNGGNEVTTFGYNSGPVTTNSATVQWYLGNDTLNVTLGTEIGTTWYYNNYTFYTPSISYLYERGFTFGDLVGNGMADLQWSQAAPGAIYSLMIGSTQGSGNYYNSGPTTALILLANNYSIPLNGQTVYITVGTLVNGVWYYNNYSFPSIAIPELLTPTNGSTITTNPVNFTWSTPTGVTSYNLQVGSTPGGSNYYNKSPATPAAGVTVPLNGQPVYVALYSSTGHTFTYSFNTIATSQLNTPTAGQTITGPVNFSWSQSTAFGATAYSLQAGSTPGSGNYYNSGQTSSLTANNVSVPLNGQPVYVTLGTLVTGVWYYNNYTFSTTTASFAPIITTQPSSVTVNAPATAQFTVAATGTPAPTYQWMQGAPGATSFTAISGATSSTYTTAATTTANSGTQYECVVTNSAGTVTSAAATLTVNAASVAPSITTQPVSVTVTAPSTATFSVVAAGSAPLSYQWMQEVSGSASFTAISGATIATYTTPATTTANSGTKYECVVTNSAGTVTSSAATLTVNAASVAPSITTQPVSATVTAPATATFSVVATGSPAPSYQWMQEASGTTSFTAISGATSASYTTAATTSASSGTQYECVVTNSIGSVTSKPATLTVGTPSPSGTTIPPAAQIIDSKGVVWTVVNGYSYENGVYDNGATITLMLYYNGIIYVDTSGSGWWSHATGSWQQISGDPRPVAPSITTQPVNVTAVAPATATFSVVAAGSATLTYQWMQEASGATLFTAISGATSASYTTAATTSASSGTQYECVVTNSIGSVTSKPATLTVGTPSPSGTTIPPAAQIIDSRGMVWTVVNGYSYENGIADGGATITLLLYYNNVIYADTSSLGWYSHAGSWAAIAGDPRPVAPSITTQPVNVTVAIPATATFSVVAAGTPTLTYQWMQEASGTTSFTAISGATSASYTTAATTSASSGTQYECVVTNSIGSVTSKPATLTVGTPSPSGTTIPPAAQIIDSKGVVWTVVNGYSYENGVYDNGATITLMLYYNGIIYVDTSGSGWWSHATGSWQQISGDPRPVAPSITTQPVNVTAVAPATATFSVVAAGSATLTYQWMQEASGATLFTAISGATSASYTTGATTSANSGTQYECVVTNSIGSVTSKAAGLTMVTPSPSGTTIPSATQIIDSKGVVWTVVNGYSYENGVYDNGATITLMLYYNGIIYVDTSGSGWWSHATGSWQQISGDPRL